MSEFTSQDQSVGMDLSVEDTSHLIQATNVLCVVKKVERQTTKSGKEPIVVSLEVVSNGADRGKYLFDRIYDRLDSKTGEAINKRRLRSLGLALGLARITSTADLNVPNKIIMAEVAIRHSQEYGASNEVRSYNAVNGNGQAVAGGLNAPVAPPLAPASASATPHVAPPVAPPVGAQDSDAF